MQRLAQSLDFLTLFFEDPPAAASALELRSHSLLGAWVVLGASASLTLSQTLFWAPIAPAGPSALLLTLSIAALFQLLAWVLLTGILHLLAEAWGKEGRAKRLLSLLAPCQLPWALALPCAILLTVLEKNSWQVWFFLCGVLGIWSLALKARSLRLNYQLRSGQAWAILAIPYLFGSLFLAALAFLTAVLFLLSMIQTPALLL